MLKRIEIAALVAAMALVSVTGATAQSRHATYHHGFGTRHALRDHHYGWGGFVMPYSDRLYYGTYILDEPIDYYIPWENSTDYVAAGPTTIEFGGYEHVDDLSRRLELTAVRLCLDLHHNYSHNPGIENVFRDAYQIYKTARSIHEKESRGTKTEVARRLDALDGLFDHVQKEAAQMSRQHQRQIGVGDVQAKLDSMDITLHHLMHDVGVNGSHEEHEAIPPPANTEAIVPPSQPVPPAN
jgi:hypothetical protein